MKRIIVLDTEFLGLDKPFVYDIGYLVLNLNGNEYQALKVESSITKQVYDNAMLFNTAYYAKKRGIYTSLLKGKQAKRRYWGHIMQTLQRDIDTYEVEAVLAYNASADSGAIAFTCNFLGIANPLETVQVIDLMPMVQSHICDTAEYKAFAETHGLVGDSGFIQTSVESVCKFVYDMPEFEEQHTALDDVGHETNLLNMVMAIGGKVENLKKKYIESSELKTMKIEIVNSEGDKREYSFKYRIKKNFKSRNTIKLTR